MYRLVVCLVIAFFGFADLPAMAQQQSGTSEQSAETRIVSLERDLEEERARSRDNEWARQLADTRAELTDAAQGRLENWIGFYGILIALLVAGAGFISWRAATGAAKDEIRTFKTRAEDIIEDLEKHRDTAEEAAKELTETAAKAVRELPGQAETETLDESDRLSIEEATEMAAAAKAGRRTATDFRLLLRRAERDRNWDQYVRLAQGMAYLHSDNVEDRAYALFAKGYGNQMLEKHELAALHYQEYLERCSDYNPEKNSVALYNWGVALAEQARDKEGEEADRLRSQAFEKFEKALAIEPEQHNAFNNWGVALDDQARSKKGKAADKLWSRAYEKFERAHAIQPDNHEVLTNWGIALAAQARANGVEEEADSLWQQAFQKYAQALAIEPDSDDALYNWATDLDTLAQSKRGEEADELWSQADEKFEQLLVIKPDECSALIAWANALIWQAHGKDGEGRERLLNKAEEKLYRTEDIRKGSGAYNLACVAGMRSDADTAAKWLREGKENNPSFPDCAHIREDKDFDSVRDTEAFQAALKDIGC